MTRDARERFRSIDGGADVDAVFELFDEDTPEEVMALADRQTVETEAGTLEDFTPELPRGKGSTDGPSPRFDPATR